MLQRKESGDLGDSDKRAGLRRILTWIVKNETEIVKYFSRVKRIGNKKSEAFASNYIKRTTPSFREMNALKDHVKRNVQEVFC